MKKTNKILSVILALIIVAVIVAIIMLIVAYGDYRISNQPEFVLSAHPKIPPLSDSFS